MFVRRALLAVGMALAASAASASIIQYTFTANGQTDGVSQQGSATFYFDTANPGWMKITLTDNVSPTANTASELDGLSFVFSDPLGSLTLQSVAAQAVLDCSGDNSVPCDPYAGVPPSLYGWGTQLSGATGDLGAGFTGSGFGYHPYAVINSNYSLPASGNGNLANGEHNPFLVGPVDFIFATGLQSVPDISSVTFLFGTVPNPQDGSCTSNCGDVPPCTSNCGDLNVPEPQTLALLGIALLTVAWTSRRKANAGSPFGCSTKTKESRWTTED